MTRPERNDAEPSLAPHTPASHRPAGQIGWLQAEPSCRVVPPGIAWTPVPERADERAVRFMSTVGGYLALGAAYVGTALLILR